mgnify:CR=1 FL=1
MSPASLSGSDDEDMIVVTKYNDANIIGVIFRVPRAVTCPSVASSSQVTRNLTMRVIFTGRIWRRSYPRRYYFSRYLNDDGHMRVATHQKMTTVILASLFLWHFWGFTATYAPELKKHSVYICINLRAYSATPRPYTTLD